MGHKKHGTCYITCDICGNMTTSHGKTPGEASAYAMREGYSLHWGKWICARCGTWAQPFIEKRRELIGQLKGMASGMRSDPQAKEMLYHLELLDDALWT